MSDIKSQPWCLVSENARWFPVCRDITRKYWQSKLAHSEKETLVPLFEWPCAISTGYVTLSFPSSYMAGKGFAACLPRVSGQVFTHLGNSVGWEVRRQTGFKVHYELRPETSPVLLQVLRHESVWVTERSSKFHQKCEKREVCTVVQSSPYRVVYFIVLWGVLYLFRMTCLSVCLDQE